MNHKKMSTFNLFLTKSRMHSENLENLVSIELRKAEFTTCRFYCDFAGICSSDRVTYDTHI